MDVTKLLLVDVMPEVAAERLVLNVTAFRARGVSGHIDIRLNFSKGVPMPPDLGVHERKLTQKG